MPKTPLSPAARRSDHPGQPGTAPGIRRRPRSGWPRSRSSESRRPRRAGRRPLAGCPIARARARRSCASWPRAGQPAGRPRRLARRRSPASRPTAARRAIGRRHGPSSARRPDAAAYFRGPVPQGPTAAGGPRDRRRRRRRCAAASRGWLRASATAVRRSGDPSSYAAGAGAAWLALPGCGPGSAGRSPRARTLRSKETGMARVYPDSAHRRGASRRTGAIVRGHHYRRASKAAALVVVRVVPGGSSWLRTRTRRLTGRVSLPGTTNW